MSEAPLVRHAERADLPAVAELATRHAEYERAAPPPGDLPDRLATLLFDTPVPRLRCLVAHLPDGHLVGYATRAPELSTGGGASICTWTACSCFPIIAVSDSASCSWTP